MSAQVTGPRKASYVLLAAALVLVARFNLGACLLSGLVSFMILDLTERRLLAEKFKPAFARWASVAVFAVLAVMLAWIFVSFLRVGLLRLPDLLDTVLPRLGAFAARVGAEFPAENARELRDLVVTTARENAGSVGKTSGLLTRGFFQAVLGLFVAVLRFLTPEPQGHDGHLYDSLRLEFNARVGLFLRSFERVMGAQVAISLLNTVLTTAFLHVMGFHYKTFLTLTTFVCGLVPIVGNVVSNLFIIASGLTSSEELAVIGLVYLVVIHKLEYLLNSRIIGDSLDTPMWMTLLGLVVGEALMGVPGVLLAPALIHYAREELRALPHKPA